MKTIQEEIEEFNPTLKRMVLNKAREEGITLEEAARPFILPEICLTCGTEEAVEFEQECKRLNKNYIKLSVKE
jgi:hypothetical protein